MSYFFCVRKLCKCLYCRNTTCCITELYRTFFVCVCGLEKSRNKLYCLQNVRIVSDTPAQYHHCCFPCFRVRHTQVYCASSDVFINEKLALKGIGVGTPYRQSFTAVKYTAVLQAELFVVILVLQLISGIRACDVMLIYDGMLKGGYCSV